VEENNKLNDTKSNIPKRIKASSNSIIILRHRGTINDATELESKYSEKFGCKVVILLIRKRYITLLD